MNSCDGSLEDGPSIVSKEIPDISLVVRAISTGLVGSTFVSVSVMSGDCEDRSKRSISK